jgi:hypothetical protein
MNGKGIIAPGKTAQNGEGKSAIRSEHPPACLSPRHGREHALFFRVLPDGRILAIIVMIAEASERRRRRSRGKSSGIRQDVLNSPGRFAPG